MLIFIDILYEIKHVKCTAICELCIHIIVPSSYIQYTIILYNILTYLIYKYISSVQYRYMVHNIIEQKYLGRLNSTFFFII